MNIVPRVFMGPELKQETYYVEGKGWRTHHVISRTCSFEREATDEEIFAAEKLPCSPPESANTDGPEPNDDPEPKKRGRPRKAE